MNYNGEELKQRVLDILKGHPEGLTLQDLSKRLNTHRQTVSKYCLVLEATGAIVRRRIGPIVLHYLTGDYVKHVKNAGMGRLRK